MSKEIDIKKLAHMFDVLGDPNRLSIVVYLNEGQQSVSNITKYLGMSQSAVSHQLRILRDANILKATKEGKSVFYSINDDHVYAIVNNGLIHMTHGE